MMRWAGLALVGALLGLAAFAYFGHRLVAGIDADQLPYLVWILMALLLVGVGAARVARRRPEGSSAPGLLLSLAIWGGAIGLIVLLYRGAAIWAAVASLLH
jgi:FtsH-binding integral membrane protein